MNYQLAGILAIILTPCLICFIMFSVIASEKKRVNKIIEENIKTTTDIRENLDKTREALDSIRAIEDELVYTIASEKTGCPGWILRGIRFAESSNGTNTMHPDPWDVGDFGLHERPEYHAERAEKWGEYDPRSLIDSAIIAGYIYAENLERLGDQDAAISAYKIGRRGTIEKGLDMEYIKKVKIGGFMY